MRGMEASRVGAPARETGRGCFRLLNSRSKRESCNRNQGTYSSTISPKSFMADSSGRGIDDRHWQVDGLSWCRALTPTLDPLNKPVCPIPPPSNPNPRRRHMTDGTHEEACGCINFRSSYTPLAPEVESNIKCTLRVRQRSETLTLTFSEIAFTVTSNKSDGSGSSSGRNARLC